MPSCDAAKWQIKMCEKLAPQKVQATSGGLTSPDEQYLLNDPSFAGN